VNAGRAGPAGPDRREETSAELDRISAFVESFQDRCAKRSTVFQWGTALWHDDFPLIWDLNFLRVERSDGDLSARRLADTAEELQGQAGLEHRKIEVGDALIAGRVGPGFDELGWSSESLVTMVHRRRPHRSVDTSFVTEVGLDELAPGLAKLVRTMPYGNDAEVVRQLVERAAVTEQAISVRHFAILVEGEPVSFCDLYLGEGIGQIEDVGTLEEQRGRGFATAVVSKALAESVAHGCDLTFLVADAEDWPKELYRKLGFDEVTTSHSFLKLPSDGAGR